VRSNSVPAITAREQQILALLAAGDSDKTLSKKLGISDKTARKHRENLLRKCGARNVCSLVWHALQSGWIAVDADLG